MHYIMNKNIPVIEIETATILDMQKAPLALRLNNITKSTIYKWITHRALPLSRKNAEKIYKTTGLSRDNQEIELMYITHSLSINDNYWIASREEIGKFKYEDISLFRNSFNETMYMIALKGEDAFTITDNDISAEYTGQGTFPKCFVRENDGVYLYKSGTEQEIKNELYACYLAEILGAKTVHYDYSILNGVQCTKSKIYTNENINWETAFILCELMDTGRTTPQGYAEFYFKEDFTNMVILDAIILNDDRHMKNWSFQLDANTNRIMGLAPNYDFNNAFRADNRTMSNLIFDYNKKVNILKAARIAYQKYGSTLKLKYLHDNISNINIDINKQALKNRIEYIVGVRDTQRNCY